MNTPTKDEMKAAIDASEAKVDSSLVRLEIIVKTGFLELRGEIEKLRAEMHKNNADMIKWGVGIGLTLAMLTVSVLTFVVRMSA